MITNPQIQTIKKAPRFLKLDDASYRTVLRNVGKVDSCKKLTQTSFEDVMAFFESQGFGEPGAHYWSDIIARRGSFASSRQVHMIHELYTDYESARGEGDTHYELSGLVANACNQYTRDPARLRPYQAKNLIEQLKSMIERLYNEAALAEFESQKSIVPCDDVPF